MRTKKAEAEKAGAETKDIARLLALMTANAPAEDLAAYDPAMLAAATQQASQALARHRSGESVIMVENDPAISHLGRRQTVVTVVNDNMPFLFDSVVAEINEAAGEASLVLHPILLVRHGADGVAEILGEAGSHGAQRGDRLSLIQVHVAALPDAARRDLAERLEHTLSQVKAAVADWKPMLARLERSIADFRDLPIPLARKELDEAVALLEWLRDDNFTFLGMREFVYRGGAETGTLERTEAPGLGILDDPQVRVLRRGGEAVNTTPEIRAFLHGPEALIVTKANAKSVVHRRIYLDYIGIKTFDRKGKLAGELRLVGLFTSTAYTRSVMSIPYLRSKAQAVVAKSGFDPSDHSGKALINVLESYPRDELFQIGLPTLRKHAAAILALGERPRVRVLARADQFDRFVSVLVYVPRDRYDSQARIRIGDFLKGAFEGRVSAYYPAFPEGTLARVHFIIGRSGGKTPKVATAVLEEGVRAIVRTWDDALKEAVAEGADPALAALAAGFPEDYRNGFIAADALNDARRVAATSAERPIAIDFLRDGGEGASHASLRIYHRGAPVALSRRVPLLENMGFRVISERTFELPDGGGETVFLHDMELESADEADLRIDERHTLFEDMFLAVWNGTVDNDRYNRLVTVAGMNAAEVTILRAYGRYLQQAGIPQSQDFIADVLARYPAIAGDLHALFVARLDPASAATGKEIAARIEAALDNVPNLDDDTIIRRYLNLIDATVRTNHFQPKGDQPLSLALKLDSRKVIGLPAPQPWREIFVYGPEVEGVHLRFGPVARGGLRWSDRAQDYRTEVLGLVKAQQVKNAVIVPVGAKGGFFPRRLPTGSGREAVFEAGRAAYINFVSSMLSVTDNLDGDRIVPPKAAVRHDGDDPYFVVAADKGTATFSDTANAISQAHDFWLDDAFASGGSAGYDHKKMGITARGGWEAVKRHFRELNRDIQNDPFTVVGVGDMSGDVFGNGMLLSQQTRLVAAFDHRDIFIDPDPDPKAGFAERQRLFDLPRSSWQDYDKAKLSKGGMIVSRSQKSIKLTAEAAKALDIAATSISPIELMSAILKAPVDLLWFGGIGTYVRAADESALDVGDRANDAIRVTGREVRARVIGEGANLGMTQRGRIEYQQGGGRSNSDAIDNSAGVNSSDIEVNIKIALASAMRSGRLTRPARNKLLVKMTGEVAALVLANNYQQTLAISLAEARGIAQLPHQARMMTALESRNLLDRKVESLPGAEALAEREARGEQLTRAEIGVLLAYAKLTLFSDLVASDLPDDPHFQRDLTGYFPDEMRKKYAAEIDGHRLRREIIATELGNDLVNRGGPTLVSRLTDISGRPAADVAAAYAIVRGGFDLPALYAAIDALDNRIDGKAQLDLYAGVGRLIDRTTAWILKNEPEIGAVGEGITELAKARAAVEPELDRLLPSYLAGKVAETRDIFAKAGTPVQLAERLAGLAAVELLPDIALAASQAEAGLKPTAKAFFAVGDAFRIDRMEEAAHGIRPADYYEGLALLHAADMIGTARRDIACAVLRKGSSVEKWLEKAGDRIARPRSRLLGLLDSGELTPSRLTVAAGIMRDIAALA